MDASAGKPACVIAAVNGLTGIQSTGLCRCYGHAPWVTHLGRFLHRPGPPALGGVNRIDTYTSVCNVYLLFFTLCMLTYNIMPRYTAAQISLKNDPQNIL